MNIINDFMNYEKKNIPEVLFQWLSKDEIERNIQKELNEVFNILNKNADVKDAGYHLLSFDDNKKLISSIRFTNQNNTRIPFIEIYAKNFNISSLNKQEVDTIFQKYKIFLPEFIRLYETNNIKEVFESYLVKVDSIACAGHINSIKILPKPEKYEKVKIKLIDSMDFYNNYSNEYELFNDEKNIQDRFVFKESKETMQNSLDDKSLFSVSIKNEFAGVFAIKKAREKYFEGYVIIEELLYKDFRGKGYGKAIQRKMIDSINAANNEFIFGIIHPKNEASLKTAKGNGRFETGYNYILKIK